MAPPHRTARLHEPTPATTSPQQAEAKHCITKTKSKAKTKLPRRDCTICDRTLSPSSFPKHSTTTCQHNNHICKLCLKDWIATQLANTTYDKLTCPECPERMQNADVKVHARPADYGRFDELERKAITESTPGWRWCLNPECKAGQVHLPLVEGASDVTKIGKGKGGKKAKGGTEKKSKKKAEDDDANVFICNSCDARACVLCDRPYHDGETCEEYQHRMQNQEEATEDLIGKVCKKCPGKGCGRNIEKSYGCDQMVCSVCGVAFCWLCLLTYDVINKDGHAKGCIYAQPGAIDPHAAHLQAQMQMQGQANQGAQGRPPEDEEPGFLERMLGHNIAGWL